MTALTCLRQQVMGKDRLTIVGIRHGAIAHLKSIDVPPGEARDLVSAALDGADRSKDGKPATLQGRPLTLIDPEPWGEPVSGAQLLNAFVTTIRTFLVVGIHEIRAIALWILHTWASDVADVAPRLVFASPEKRCGKSRGVGLLSALVRRALPVSGLSGPALFRTIELHEPTILADEMDNAKLNHPDRADLLAVFNSGWSREAPWVIRCVGQDLEPRAFNVRASVSLALIGHLPSTLADRSITIRMKRKATSAKVERFRKDRLNRELEPFRRMAARWAKDHRAALEDLDPEVPAELDDRAADNWRPLLGIADLAGEEWPSWAREAATVLSQSRGKDDSSAGVMLLGDIRIIFDSKGVDRRSTEQLRADLADLEDRPWGEWSRGKVINARQLSRLLQPFDITPGTIRLEDGTTPKGYKLESFEEAFSLYLPPPDPPQRHND